MGLAVCRPSARSGQKGEILGFNGGKGRIQHFPARNDDEVEPANRLMAPKDLAGEAFGAIAIDGRPQLSRGGNAQPCCRPGIRHDEQRHQTAVLAGAIRLGAFELGPAANPLRARQSEPSRHYRSSATVRRLRPLARRRLSTMRPFFVAIRTRNPCVFLRRRVLGW